MFLFLLIMSWLKPLFFGGVNWFHCTSLCDDNKPHTPWLPRVVWLWHLAFDYKIWQEYPKTLSALPLSVHGLVVPCNPFYTIAAPATEEKLFAAYYRRSKPYAFVHYNRLHVTSWTVWENLSATAATWHDYWRLSGFESISYPLDLRESFTICMMI